MKKIKNKTRAPSDFYESTVRDFFDLLKPRVMSLVVFTGAVGMILAPGHIHPFLAVISVLCIAIGAGASGAMNMWFDADIDALMERTQKRPIPSGRVEPSEALALGVILSILSVGFLGLALNWLAAGLLAFTIFFYAVIYTIWLKRVSPQNIVIGGAAGALPPVIGWAAVTGNVTLFPILLFMIIFFWTPPHFWSLALVRADDYAKAKVPMWPVLFGEASTKRQILIYSVIMLPVALSPYLFGFTGPIYGAYALWGSLLFIQKAIRLRAPNSSLKPMSYFGYSIRYLFYLFIALLVDHYVGVLS